MGLQHLWCPHRTPLSQAEVGSDYHRIKTAQLRARRTAEHNKQCEIWGAESAREERARYFFEDTFVHCGCPALGRSDLIFLLLNRTIPSTRNSSSSAQARAGQVPCLPAFGGMEPAGRKRGRDGGDREDAAVNGSGNGGGGGGGNQRPRRRNRFAPVAPVDEVSK